MLTANAYIAAVETADGQSLESGVKSAITDFIVGCHNDGIWSAIKASCILAGARTLSGALVPLVGTAPTNSNFVTADYNRKTGLKANGATKFLDSRRNNNADPQNNYHASIYRGEEITVTHAASFLGAGASGVAGRSTLQNNYLSQFTNGYFVRARSSAGPLAAASSQNAAGFLAVSRASASTISYSAPGNQSGTLSVTSEPPHNGNIWIFAVNNSGSIFSQTDNRLSFYSVGESLDLAKFGTQVRTLMTSLAAAIP
jgi:hypothetical protein